MKNTNNTLAAIQLTQVIEQLNNLPTDELVNLYIEYASENSYETIYNLDESTINDLYTSPWQALYDSNHKDFNDRDYFFTYNGNGHMVSFSNEDDSNCPIDISELAQWLINEDKLSEYHITVTTLDDMYNCILDNLEDIDSLSDIIRVNDLLGLSLNEFDSNNESPADYEANLINNIMFYIEDNYQLLSDVIDHLGINYQ